VDNFFIFLYFVAFFSLGFVLGYILKRNKFCYSKAKKETQQARRQLTQARQNKIIATQLKLDAYRCAKTTIIRPTTNKTKQVINDIIND